MRHIWRRDSVYSRHGQVNATSHDGSGRSMKPDAVRGDSVSPVHRDHTRGWGEAAGPRCIVASLRAANVLDGQKFAATNRRMREHLRGTRKVAETHCRPRLICEPTGRDHRRAMGAA